MTYEVTTIPNPTDSATQGCHDDFATRRPRNRRRNADLDSRNLKSKVLRCRAAASAESQRWRPRAKNPKASRRTVGTILKACATSRPRNLTINHQRKSKRPQLSSTPSPCRATQQNLHLHIHPASRVPDSSYRRRPTQTSPSAKTIAAHWVHSSASMSADIHRNPSRSVLDADVPFRGGEAGRGEVVMDEDSCAA